MRDNLFPGDCAYCGRPVPKFGGKHWYGESGTCVAHNGCLTGDEVDVAPPPQTSRKASSLPGPGRRMTRDYGGNQRGAKVKTKGNTEMYECVHCGHRQREVKAARLRRSRVRCPDCSVVMQPMTAHRTKKLMRKLSKSKKKCRRMGCYARIPKDGDIAYCNGCFNAMDPSQRANVLGGRAAGGRLGPPAVPKKPEGS